MLDREGRLDNGVARPEILQHQFWQKKCVCKGGCQKQGYPRIDRFTKQLHNALDNRSDSSFSNVHLTCRKYLALSLCFLPLTDSLHSDNELSVIYLATQGWRVTPWYPWDVFMILDTSPLPTHPLNLIYILSAFPAIVRPSQRVPLLPDFPRFQFYS